MIHPSPSLLVSLACMVLFRHAAPTGLLANGIAQPKTIDLPGDSFTTCHLDRD